MIVIDDRSKEMLIKIQLVMIHLIHASCNRFHACSSSRKLCALDRVW